MFRLTRKQKKTIGIITSLTVVVIFVVTLLQPFRYRATTRMLIVQRQGFALDAYSALKSAERIGANVSQLVETSSFMASVMARDSGLPNDFSDDPIIRRKQWGRMVDARIEPGTGLLTIEVYHQNTSVARAFSDVIAAELQSRVAQLWPDSVQMQIVDYPVASRYPVKPNIFVNVIAGLFLGLLISGAVIVVKDR